ncbi:MAG: hypothetical protein K9M80_04145 [Candidatus Marinimicrobia bacterium]|nr:hypothetical protein [Candidatus Neomarinimicrobiota bacterium]
MRLIKLLKKFKQLSIFNKIRSIVKLTSLGLIFLTLCVNFSCEEKLPGLLRDKSFTEFTTRKIKGNSVDLHLENPDNQHDRLLYIGEDQDVKCNSFIKYDLSESSFNELEADSIVSASLTFYTFDQLHQGEGDSVDMQIKVSRVVNDLNISESEYVDYSAFYQDTVGIASSTIQDSLTSSSYFTIDLPIEKMAAPLTQNSSLTLLLDSDNKQEVIQTIYSQNYNAEYLELRVGYWKDNDTSYTNMTPTADIADINYKKISKDDSDLNVITEGLESYLVVPIALDTTYSINTIVTKANLEIEAGEVVDYNSGIPLSITEVDTDFVLSEIDSSDRNTSYVYNDDQDSTITLDVKAFIENAIQAERKKLKFVIWCEDVGPDITRFYIKNKKYDLKILTANQEIKD